MKKLKIKYLISVISFITLGILSRKITGIPLFIGDLLYAVLIYLGFRFLIVKSEKSTSLLFSLLFCFGIEFLQLVQIDWLITIRKTTLGHYILGQSFLWSDLICYVIGTLLAFLIDWKFVKTQNLNS